MRKGRLSARETAEINSLVESSHEALVETVKELRLMQVRRLEAKAVGKKTGP